eukprot:NODE_324_length_10963_cov_0.175350.p8 type:complete len:105 gc:universal NODE_324_length_10963_cov_0.175350:7679-7993(+)
MNKAFDFKKLIPEDMDAPSYSNKRTLHRIIKSTLKKYQSAHLSRKIQLRAVLSSIQYQYPLTFTCTTEPALIPKEVITRLHHMVRGKITTAANIEEDPMYDDLL